MFFFIFAKRISIHNVQRFVCYCTILIQTFALVVEVHIPKMAIQYESNEGIQVNFKLAYIFSHELSKKNYMAIRVSLSFSLHLYCGLQL